MVIPDSIPTLWYENKNGERWVPNYSESPLIAPPDGFIYQRVQRPNELHDRINRCETDKSKEVAHGTRGWSPDLVNAMVRSGMDVKRAIQIAAGSCERCMNSLAHWYELDWGYPEYGVEWKAAHTECDFCAKGTQ